VARYQVQILHSRVKMALCRRERVCDFHTARSISGHSRGRLPRAAVALAVALGAVLAGLAAPAAAETPRERCRAVMSTAPRAEAIAACDHALELGASAEDMWAAAAVRTARPETPTMDDLIRADLLAAAAARLAPGEPWGAL